MLICLAPTVASAAVGVISLYGIFRGYSIPLLDLLLSALAKKVNAYFI